MKRQVEIERVRSADGRRLIVHRFDPAPGAPCIGAAMILHGIQSHAGWYRETATRLADCGIMVAVPERRGSGVDRQNRGDAPSVAALLADARAVSRALCSWSGHRPVWIGVSWGGKLAALVAHESPAEMSALALVCPGIHPRIDLDRRSKARIAFDLLIGARSRFAIPLGDPELWSDVEAHRHFVAEDPLSLRSATARFFMVTRALDRRLLAKHCRLSGTLPVLLVLAVGDRIIDNDATMTTLRFWAPQRLQTLLLHSARHTPELSTDHAIYMEWLVEFCRRVGGRSSEPLKPGLASLESDRYGAALAGLDQVAGGKPEAAAHG